MRFYKVLQNTKANAWTTDLLNEGDIICFSAYFKQLIVVSNSREKTKFLYSPDRWRLNLILSEKVRPLTQKELNKIKPHLRVEHLKYDL